MKLKNVKQHTGQMADNRDGTLINTLISPISNSILNRALNTPGIAIGLSSAAKVKITNATMCLINGKQVLVATQEVAFTAITHNIADGYLTAFLVTVDAAGTVELEMGSHVLIASGIGEVDLPEIDANKAVIGMVSVATAAAPFVAATTLLSAATVTDLYYDIVGPVGLR